MALLSAGFSFRGVLVSFFVAIVPGMAFSQPTAGLAHDFQEAERLFWLDNWVKARNLYANCEVGFAKSDPAKALICKFSRLRADAETNLSYYTVSKLIATDLEAQTARNSPEARLRGLIVKATADLSIHDPVLSGEEWEEVQRLAHSLKEDGWETRAKGELGIVAYLRGDTAKAVALNTESFLKSKALNDVAGMVRALSLKGVGLLERKAADQALSYFDQALDLAKANPDVRFPLMAYMGKAQALESQEDMQGAARLLQQANQFVESIGMTVYKADLAIALGVQAERRGRFADAEAEFERARRAATLAHMPRPYADAMFHKIELRERNSDWHGAELLLPMALKADRELIDIQFLPQHLAQAADVEIRVGNIRLAREYLSQARDVIEAALAKAPSPNIERSLISTMSDVFIAQFELALNQDRNLPTAFEIVENARSRVIAQHLRAADKDSAVSTARTKAINAEIASIQLNLISSAHTPGERSGLLQALGEAESELDAAQLNRTRHSHPSRTIPVRLPTIQVSMSPDELLLEFIVSEKSSFVLAVTRDTSRAYRITGAKDLDSLVARYTEEAMRADPLPESSRPQARRLFDVALGEITELAQKQRVIIVADGALNSVGFDSLIDASNQYLVRTHTVSYVPSATVLHILRHRPSNLSAAYSILAFGAPELPNQVASAHESSATSSRALLDISGGEITRLRSASGEIRTISSELGGASQVFLGVAATEARFKSESISSFRVIHFATHAFADVHHPERSAIVLAPDAKTGDDGLLQIREIQNLTGC
ncbi:MAG: CHAT domain-containing protein [Bryobacteraceae bacterium]